MMEKAEYYYTKDYLCYTPHRESQKLDVFQIFHPQAQKPSTTCSTERQRGEKNRVRFSQELYGQVNPAGCTNLSPAAFNLLSLLQQYLRNFGGNNIKTKYLALLQQLQVPVFLVNSSQMPSRGVSPSSPTRSSYKSR